MELTNCKDDGTLKYCLYKDEYYIGNNSTIYGNAPVLGRNFNGTLDIPDYFDSKPIVALGQYSFANCLNLKKAIIGKNVREIHTYALGDLANVEIIFISSSVEFLGPNGIGFYNTTIQPMSKGIKQIIFYFNSKPTY